MQATAEAWARFQTYKFKLPAWSVAGNEAQLNALKQRIPAGVQFVEKWENTFEEADFGSVEVNGKTTELGEETWAESFKVLLEILEILFVLMAE